MKYTAVGVDIAEHLILIQIHFIDENTSESRFTGVFQ